MNLEHSFTVPTGIDEAWTTLLDIERIGPCMPGATIESVDGDDFTGSVKVKLGPISLTYKGKASFVEKDEATHKAVIDARGRDARGNGTASAKVTATLTDEGGNNTKVLVNTDLDITGKPAQFGRGVMVDVGNKLIGQFADCLAETISGGGSAGAAESDSSSTEAAASSPAKSTASPAAKSTASPAAKSTASPAAKSTAKAATSKAAPKAPSKASARRPAAAGSLSGGGAASSDEPAVKATGPAQAVSSSDTPSVNGSSDSAAAESPAQKLTTAPKPAPRREAEPINLLESAGPAVAKRLAPVAGVIALVAAIIWWRRR